MWCIIIRQYDGEYIRETVEDDPELSDLQYWEDYYSMSVTDNSRPYYDNLVSHKACVVNVFQLWQVGHE